MKIRVLLFISFLLLVHLMAFAQGRMRERLVIGATTIAQGEIKIAEPLMSYDGSMLTPGHYRVSIALTSRGEALFIFSLFQVDKPPAPEISSQGPVNRVMEMEATTYVAAYIVQNTLPKGIASNIPGTFTVVNLAPTEMLLRFTSKQFEASAILGRSPESKTIDLFPVSTELEGTAPCGENCIEGHVRIKVKNNGGSAANGKWNVVLISPPFYVGTLTDLPPDAEEVVKSERRIQLPCCLPLTVEAEVHADFYNQEGIDSDESNNTKKFTVNLK